MNILCVVPARGGSKRLPGKNIMPIFGKPLIAHTFSHAKASKLIDRLVCSTDDEKIASVAKAEGVDVLMRPAEISGDTAAIEDTLRHVARTLEQRDGWRADIVTMLLANVAYRRDGLIDETIQKLIDDPSLTSTLSCFKVNQRPEWMFKLDGPALKLVNECKFYRQQDLPDYYLPDGAVISLRMETLEKTEGLSGAYKYLGERIGHVIQDRMFGIEVDHPDDVAAAEILLKMMSDRDARNK